MIPVVFRTPRSLGALNVAAVGFAMAAMTSVAFTIGGMDGGRDWSLTAGLSTLVFGTVWAAVLRTRETVGASKISLGWVLSAPLAALNAGVACGLMFMAHEGTTAGAFFGGILLGTTFGALIWLPALVMVLVLFGVPIARARRLAKQGLAGEERGERVVGLVCVALATLALVLSLATHEAMLLFQAYAVLAALSGGAATIIAAKREAKRRRFVTRVETGEVPGLRVETRSTGKVLLRVTSKLETYRVVAEPDEELVELDDEGRARRALVT